MLARIALRAALVGALIAPLAACNEEGEDTTTAETSTTVPADTTTGVATSGSTEAGN